jgi:hypothetical protein
MASIRVNLSYTVKDANGTLTAVQFRAVSVDGTLIDIIALHDNMLLSLDTVIDGQIVDSSVTLDPGIPTSGIKTAPNTGAENERGLLYTMLVTGSDKSYSRWIPGWQPAGFDGSELNYVHPYDFFLGFLNNAQDGVTHHYFANDNYQPLHGSTGGRKAYRKQRKGLKHGGY